MELLFDFGHLRSIVLLLSLLPNLDFFRLLRNQHHATHFNPYIHGHHYALTKSIDFYLGPKILPRVGLVGRCLVAFVASIRHY